MMSLLAPLVVAVAPSGARRTKADHPALPMTADEIGLEAARCAVRGAAMIHLHVREADGRHSLDVELYRIAMAAIRREAGPDLIIQVTTEAAGLYRPDEQMTLVRTLQPEAVSLALAELIPDVSAETEAASFYAWLAEAGVRTQHILYSPADVARLLDLARRGLIPEGRPHGLFVLGRHDPRQESQPSAMMDFLNLWPRENSWSLCAFGQAETACLAAAAALGGHVRVGFENSILRPDGSLAESNAEAVERIVAITSAFGRSLASPAQARSM